jgi:putative heme iron utilization protein
VSFAPEVVEAIKRHMNGDHAEDCVVIVRALGGRPTATAALMSGMDSDTVSFEATIDGGPVPVRIRFSQTLTERAQVRVEIVRMYEEACQRLGLPTRTH